MKSGEQELMDLLALAPGVPVAQYVDQLAHLAAGTGGIAALLATLAQQVARLEALTVPDARALAREMAALQRLAAGRRKHELPDGLAGWSKIDEYGMPLRMDSLDWHAMRDQGYQLMWTVNPQMQIEWSHRFIRYRWPAVQNTLAALNRKGWCGHRDWRVPTIDELHTLSHTARKGEPFGIAEQWFPDVHGDGLFWSSSRDATHASAVQAWDFETGTAVTRNLSAYAFVRFVRSTDADA